MPNYALIQSYSKETGLTEMSLQLRTSASVLTDSRNSKVCYK